MENRILTCIVCPKGCTIEVSFDSDGKIADIVGNSCKRGAVYAENECTHPRRTVTSTVRCECGDVVPVKTSDTVPKELIFDVMKEINSVIAPDRLSIGDTVIKNVCNTGADIVATANHN